MFMKNMKKIKQKILEDDNFATSIQYMMSKVILENPVNLLKFVYKKYRVVKGYNNKFSIFDIKNNKKLYGGIYFQDTAKYIITHIKNPSKCHNILRLEKELFRHKDKILFFEKYYNQKPTFVIECKLTNMYYFYNLCKNSLLNLFNNDM